MPIYLLLSNCWTCNSDKPAAGKAAKRQRLERTNVALIGGSYSSAAMLVPVSRLPEISIRKTTRTAQERVYALRPEYLVWSGSGMLTTLP
ncbi:MAG: hypothetical protein JXA25_18105 [Anaerolineales bacterium]|nr:hypothetical protein [Anaerolineales bacterium]